MDRRKFLVVSSQAGVIAGLAGFFPAWAAEGLKFRNFISIHFDAGWDVVLGLDPKVKDAKISDTAIYLGYRPDEILRAGNLRFGPAALPIVPLASRCVVINGVSMLGNISHPDCTRMAQTGVIDRRTAEIPVLKAVAEGVGVLNENAQIENGRYNIQIVGASDMKDFVANTQFVPLEPDSYIAQQVALQSKYGEAIATLLKQYPNLDLTQTNPAIAVALQTGYARAAHILLRPGGNNLSLDTHSNHARDHKQAQLMCWQQVADLVQVLSSVPASSGSGSVFDETLMMITSEFSREASLNGASVQTSGKEHNGYTNSYMLLGGRLNGGYSIGESVIQQDMLGHSFVHTARNFNFTTGKVIHKLSDDPAYMADATIKKQIQPGHIVRTLADMFGYRDLLDPTLKSLPTLPLKA